MRAVLDARRDTDIMPFSYGSRSIKGMLIIEDGFLMAKQYSEAPSRKLRAHPRLMLEVSSSFRR
jgi:hypothetical protein